MNVEVTILDNDPIFLEVTKEALENKFTIATTTDTNVFIQSANQPAIVILDWFLDYGITGIDVMRKINAKNPLCHFIFISSEASKQVLLSVINEGWGCFFIEKTKSNFFDELIEKIKIGKEILSIKLEAATIAVTNNQKLQDTLEETLKTLEGSYGGDT